MLYLTASQFSQPSIEDQYTSVCADRLLTANQMNVSFSDEKCPNLAFLIHNAMSTGACLHPSEWGNARAPRVSRGQLKKQIGIKKPARLKQLTQICHQFLLMEVFQNGS